MLDGLHARESERAVLGSLLMDGMQAMEHCIRVHEEMFYISGHRTLFREIVHLYNSGRDWNLVSLTEFLKERRTFEGITGNVGSAYLGDLMDAVPYQRWNPGEHVERLIEAWKRRRGADICERYGKELQAGESAEECLSRLQTAVFDVIAEGQEQEDPLVMYHATDELDLFLAGVDKPEASMGLSYGNAKLDAHTFGMQPGEVTVVGARSGVGKSSLMCQSIAANCKSGVPVDCYSLEMARGRVLRRLFAIDSAVEYRKVHRPFLSNLAEQQAVREAAFRVAEWPLRIYEEAGMKIDEIVARARMSVRRYGTKLICVDYAQIVEGEGKDDRTRVSAVSQKLRKLAKEEGCHVMLLSQLRKVPHEQYNHAPTAQDLRETGQIENDAHAIVLLHRPWDDQRKQISHDAEIIVPKCRDGQTGAHQSRFEPRSLTFA
jgi:replicative DNA helicase